MRFLVNSRNLDKITILVKIEISGKIRILVNIKMYLKNRNVDQKSLIKMLVNHFLLVNLLQFST